MKISEIIKKYKKGIFMEKRENYELNIEQMNEILRNNINTILLDVRSKQEYSDGHLYGAINIPEYEISRQIEKIIPDKNSEIIIYCQVGNRSKKAYKILSKMQYKNIYVLKDGIDGINENYN